MGAVDRRGGFKRERQGEKVRRNPAKEAPRKKAERDSVVKGTAVSNDACLKTKKFKDS